MPLDIPIGRQIACVKRELAMRHRVYPRWVAQKRMTAEQAANELATMTAVLETLEDIQKQQQPELAI